MLDMEWIRALVADGHVGDLRVGAPEAKVHTLLGTPDERDGGARSVILCYHNRQLQIGVVRGMVAYIAVYFRGLVGKPTQPLEHRDLFEHEMVETEFERFLEREGIQYHVEGVSVGPHEAKYYRVGKCLAIFEEGTLSSIQVGEAT